jgi:universal stress protein A
MSIYKKIIVAIDLNAEYEHVLQRAMGVCESSEDVSLVYVTMPIVYLQPLLYGGEYNAMTDSEAVDDARKKLEGIGDKFGINRKNVHVKTGDISDEIKTMANEFHADLIIIGTHGRSGIKALLGSTANAVLHGVKQDVLAVRMNDD